jgi:hypothetical protein
MLPVTLSTRRSVERRIEVSQVHGLAGDVLPEHVEIVTEVEGIALGHKEGANWAALLANLWRRQQLGQKGPFLQEEPDGGCAIVVESLERVEPTGSVHEIAALDLEEDAVVRIAINPPVDLLSEIQRNRNWAAKPWAGGHALVTSLWQTV